MKIDGIENFVNMNEEERKQFIIINKDELISRGITHYVTKNLYCVTEELNGDVNIITEDDFYLAEKKYTLVNKDEDNCFWIIDDEKLENVESQEDFPMYQDVSDNYVALISELK